MSSFRVVTWNVLYREVLDRLPQLTDRLTEINADVALLQETTIEHATTLAESLNLRLVAHGEVRPGEVNSTVAVLTRQNLPVQVTVRPLASSERQSFYYLAADMMIDNHLVRFGTTHLRNTQHAGELGVDDGYRRAAQELDSVASIANESIRGSVEMRCAQLAQIAQFRRGLRSADAEILAGDMNFLPDGIEYRTILGWGMSDAWRAAPRLGSGATILQRNPLIADPPTVYSDLKSSVLHGARGDLDYTLDFQFFHGSLMAGPAWLVGDVDPGDEWPSDHLGIVVEYSLK